ncbi:GLPGLI family protein [Pedobacter sp. Hv1]|uniref:GLPGLI family protein n=1 Tax=Pedobacter sp. Hv1 TaxID=1740090 RepID=UPI0006D8BBFA|nr:GLPGLI family protein [Pedobacter sp. Hv1]KQB98940.1 hypothetical protein AQF98_19620 [Pedobacter sp. Hv1]
MKTILTTLFAIAISTTAIAQQPDKALIRVKYALSHLSDTTKRDNFYKETMMLVAGKNASVFLSYDKVLRDMQAKEALQEQVKQQVSNGGLKSITMPPRKRQFSETEFYYYANEAKLFTKEQLGVTYLVEENAEKIDWKIMPETLNIEGISCKKATANFRGRNWTAWFAEELPFASGPWKLVGLPGLIIQAYDEQKEVSFDFAGLESIAENKNKATENSLGEYDIKKYGSSNVLSDNEIKLPAGAVKATIKEIKRLREARANDPQGFAKAQMAAMGLGGLQQVSTGNRTTAPIPATVFNNPIEKKSPN